MSGKFWILTGESSVWPDKMTCGICQLMTLNLKQKIINIADGLLNYLTKKMCPTRPASCPGNIKPGLTNALIREKNDLQACSGWHNQSHK